MVKLYTSTEHPLPENIAEVENGPDEGCRTTDQQQPFYMYIFCQILYKNN